MSERLVRIDELASGYTPDLPDQKPILWEDGRGVLFIDRTLQPMPGQIPLMSAGVPVNAICGAGDLIFLGTTSSVLTYSLTAAEITDVTPQGHVASGDWSFQPFGKWVYAVHGEKLWVWKPRDDNQFILDETGEPTEEENPAYWPYSTMQEVENFTARGYVPKFLLKCKNFWLLSVRTRCSGLMMITQTTGPRNRGIWPVTCLLGTSRGNWLAVLHWITLCSFAQIGRLSR